MYIYKLNYTDKEAAISDLLKKEVYVKFKDLNDEVQLSYGQGIQAIVELGKIVKVAGIYDEDFKEVKATEFYDGYAFDIMSDVKIDFGKLEVFPITIVHGFAGYEPIKEVKYEPTTI